MTVQNNFWPDIPNFRRTFDWSSANLGRSLSVDRPLFWALLWCRVFGNNQKRLSDIKYSAVFKLKMWKTRTKLPMALPPDNPCIETWDSGGLRKHYTFFILTFGTSFVLNIIVWKWGWYIVIDRISVFQFQSIIFTTNEVLTILERSWPLLVNTSLYFY